MHVNNTPVQSEYVFILYDSLKQGKKVELTNLNLNTKRVTTIEQKSEKYKKKRILTRSVRRLRKTRTNLQSKHTRLYMDLQNKQ